MATQRVFLPTLNGVEMELKAVDFLQLNKIHELYKGFNPLSSIIEAGRQRVCIGVWMEEMEKDDVEEVGVKAETWMRMGNLASRCAWQLQEDWRVGKGKQIQNNFCYTHLCPPASDDLVGEATTTTTGAHLSYSMYTNNGKRRVPVGEGTSTLTIVSSEPSSKQQDLEAVIRFGRPRTTSESSTTTTPSSPRVFGIPTTPIRRRRHRSTEFFENSPKNGLCLQQKYRKTCREIVWLNWRSIWRRCSEIEEEIVKNQMMLKKMLKQ